MTAPAVDGFEPHRYPWTTGPANVVLVRSGTRPVEVTPGRRLGRARVAAPEGAATVEVDALLATEGGPPVGARTLVVAVGSNASPDVLRAKYLRSGRAVLAATPFVRCTAAGLGVGFSAHVSRRGYVAAAPFVAPGAQCRLTASFLDPAQLAVVDATEPNYRRVLVRGGDHPLTLDTGERPASYHLYVSVHGVLAHPTSGEQAGRWPQEALFRWLAAITGDTVFRGDPVAVSDRLAQEDEQRRLRRLFAERGLARRSGLAAREVSERSPSPRPSARV